MSIRTAVARPVPLAWSEPRPGAIATVTAEDDLGSWRISPWPRDVARIHFEPRRPDGRGRLGSHEPCAYGETRGEAEIVVETLRRGTRNLADWRVQLEAAGFRRAYPDETGTLSRIWKLDHGSGLLQIVVDETGDEPSVHATYESGRATFWHNLCRVGDDPAGLPDGVDVLKAGVAAALAVIAARRTRGGRFATPLGGPKPR